MLRAIDQALTRTAMTLQIDFLEHSAVNDVIIMTVVLEEVRHRNKSVHQRLRALTASSHRRFFVFNNEHHRRGPHSLPPGMDC